MYQNTKKPKVRSQKSLLEFEGKEKHIYKRKLKEIEEKLDEQDTSVRRGNINPEQGEPV
jgi:ABC-type Zn2+ transport system substrate-binding protein/surface adhesin